MTRPKTVLADGKKKTKNVAAKAPAAKKAPAKAPAAKKAPAKAPRSKKSEESSAAAKQPAKRKRSSSSSPPSDADKEAKPAKKHRFKAGTRANMDISKLQKESGSKMSLIPHEPFRRAIRRLTEEIVGSGKDMRWQREALVAVNLAIDSFAHSLFSITGAFTGEFVERQGVRADLIYQIAQMLRFGELDLSKLKVIEQTRAHREKKESTEKPAGTSKAKKEKPAATNAKKAAAEEEEAASSAETPTVESVAVESS